MGVTDFAQLSYEQTLSLPLSDTEFYYRPIKGQGV